jgi:tetrahydromethanopterin S-methyltransferase subunit F
VLGYDHAARGKRLQNAIIGTGSGLIVGIVSAIIFKPFK